MAFDSDLGRDAPCALLVIDATDLVTRVNRTFLEWMGCSEADLIGSTFPSMLTSADQVFYATQLQDSLWSTSRVSGVTLILQRVDGGTLAVVANARTIVDDSGEIVGARLALFEAESRQHFEREMLRAKRVAEASEYGIRILQEAAALFLTAQDERTVASQLITILGESFSALDSAVVAYNEAGDGSYRVVEGEQLRPVLEEVRATRDDGKHPLRQDQLIVIHDIEEAFARSESLGDALRTRRAAAFIGVPFSDGGETVGAFGAIFGRPREFGDVDLDLYRALARQTALAFSRVRLSQRLRELATRDQLTGLVNRSSIDDRIADVLDSARSGSRPAAVLFIDLDGFKRINDSFGHRTGDLILQSVALRLLRDVRDGDVVGRFGGDEFVIICADTDLEAATAIASRITKNIAEPIGDWAVTTSVGVALFDPEHDDGETVGSLIRRADLAMYESKRGGRNRVTIAAS